MKRGPGLGQVAALLGAAAFGALIAVVALRIAGGGQPPMGAGLGAAILVAAMVYMLCIGVHEGGHLAAGLLAGYRPLLLIVGPLRIEWSGGRTTLGFNRTIALAGGLAVCTPVGVYDLRRRTMIMAAGGPLASLLLGVQSLAIWQAGAAGLASPAPIVSVAGSILLVLGIVSLAIGVITLLPMRAGGFYSDGARILRLLRDDADTEREVALLALTGYTLGGARPREWDPALVALAAGIRDGGAFEVGGLQFAHLHALDSGDIEAARAYLEEALARMHQLPAAARNPVQLGAAVFFALYDRDAARARQCLDAAGPGGGLLSTPHQRLLADAAVRLAEGDVSGAASAAAAARELMEHGLDRGSVAMDTAHAERILTAAVAGPGSPG
jgi:hypothetical protein